MSWPAALRAEPRGPPIERESAKEFVDSLSENVLAPDTSQIYRKNGQRREVDLSRGFTASLDEISNTRLGSSSPLPGVAQAPGRIASLNFNREPWSADAWYRKLSTGREHGGGAAVSFAPGWQLAGSLRQQHNDLLYERRRDDMLGLRWRAAETVRVDVGWHRARLTPSLNPDPTQPPGADGEASFLHGRVRWTPTELPGLGLQLAAEEPLRHRSDVTDEDLTRGKLEFGADYRFGEDSALQGTTLYWREALRLGLLSDGDALDKRAAYRRTLGIEWPEGSPGGAVYSQLRQKSLVDDRDTLWILGWRHAMMLAPRWSLQTHIEQATPLAGPSAVRSLTLGGRLRHSRHPLYSFAADIETVDSSERDSLYGAVKYTRRLGDAWLSAFRLSTSHSQPHGEPQLDTTDYKASVGVAWRHPDARRLAALVRYTLAGTETNEAASADRRAHIVLAGASYEISDQQNAMVRGSRRWERNETLPQFDRRVTDFALLRYAYAFEPSRWSLSGHLAWRRDPLDGRQSGYGAELGYKLGRKAVLALGYNPRGFSDSELTLDERPKQGWVLRLRFSVDAVLSRWLDPPMPQEHKDASEQ